MLHIVVYVGLLTLHEAHEFIMHLKKLHSLHWSLLFSSSQGTSHETEKERDICLHNLCRYKDLSCLENIVLILL